MNEDKNFTGLVACTILYPQEIKYCYKNVSFEVLGVSPFSNFDENIIEEVTNMIIVARSVRGDI